MRWFRRYNSYMESQAKVEALLKTLNRGKVQGEWIAAPGNNALTIVEINGTEANFNPSSGMPLKAFININTGEIKIYHASVFMKDTDGK